MMFIETAILSQGESIKLDELIQRILNNTRKEEIGGIAVFIGIVKGIVDNTRVIELDYSMIEDMALRNMENIAREEASKHDILGVVIYHRVGSLKPGEIALLVIVAGRSRKNVLPALSSIVERIKHEIPVFKLEKRVDGEYWVIGDGERYPRKR
ncbi:MAG: molybdenum cofactor biosynthesis protein MoaE [Desulfurococcaceae archaeon]